jgi:putative oxidoreductase
MNIVLWVVQALLAIAFVAHGALFLFPPAAMIEQMNATLPRWFQLLLGIAEIAAAVGLTLPGLTRVKPRLVPAAAGGIMIVMAGATILHLGRAEHSSAATTVTLLALATFVAYERWRVHPIRPRTAVTTQQDGARSNASTPSDVRSNSAPAR